MEITGSAGFFVLISEIHTLRKNFEEDKNTHTNEYF